MILSGGTATILVVSEVAALLETMQCPGAKPATPIPQKVNLVLPEAFLPSGLHLKQLPGAVYETLPYSILLKVPGEVDDRCILNRPAPLPPMPELHPKMRLIPACQGQK